MQFTGHRNISRPDGSTDYSWHSYTCPHCLNAVSGAVVALYEADHESVAWLMCTNCGDAAVSALDGSVYPSVPAGPTVDGLPTDVAAAYTEARKSFGVGAFTACELVCRKILMHVAVEKGAEEGKSFAHYVSHLETAGYVTPPMKPWVDLIRQHGNESTHELPAPEERRAESTLVFTAHLLKSVYEMDKMTKLYTQTEEGE